jgi:Pyruvate:ferredoxin oxidoreductase and related 2-oxoacid:ferredoxin oxidoreductases, gamma subunit
MTITWKIGGEAGFGIMTTGLLFSKIASRLGYQILDYVEYPSLVRGGHNAYEVCVSNEEVTALKKEIDVLVCLNEETLQKHKKRLNSQSLVVYDKEEFDFEDSFQKVNVPFKKIIADLKGQAVMKNTIALGASLAVLGGKIEILLDLIKEQFNKKGVEIVKFNQQFAIAGYEEVKKNNSSLIKNFLVKKKKKKKNWF